MTEMRALGREELPLFEAAAHSAFHEEGHPADLEIDGRLLEPDRTLAIFDAGDVVATAAALSRELTVPGGAVPVAAVTGVGVVAGHTRRGHLRALMRRQLDDVRERGEPVAALWASEGGIYGRFGYGPATRACRYELHLWRAKLRAPSDAGKPDVVRLLKAARAAWQERVK